MVLKWYYNGGGTAPNKCDKEGTELAAAQPAIPAVHTNVSGVSCPCCTICCSCACGKGPCWTPPTATWYICCGGMGGGVPCCGLAPTVL